MKNVLSAMTLVTILLLSVSAIAAEKVVVVPLGKRPAGDAVAADVLEGKTFSNDDAVAITGTMPTQTINQTSPVVESGYYDATTLDVVDSDLAGGNIKSGISIFGVSGTYPNPSCMNTERTACEGWCASNYPAHLIPCMQGCTTMALFYETNCL